jgi:hypothetical protein
MGKISINVNNSRYFLCLKVETVIKSKECKHSTRELLIIPLAICYSCVSVRADRMSQRRQDEYGLGLCPAGINPGALVAQKACGLRNALAGLFTLCVNHDTRIR